ncbi:hypothetical protein TVAG_462520 [Trichomonas vaginalis G3]|uniref:Uncharacterized protein n=1 Tax=Trichomonas vaginalis (strain ATCC PRA-98 / G3) TaxID=412133 RepID=A2DLW3_TRIV3|nr:hypothetical protein TVAGG3_1012390 [Trichomonas vaginalis G3]EAY18566.1 hypothetical protein TVAG_462520 [Trichomonas vaginalis G3]KAI5491593.1 hypothetical protein TVAGG3_1012390 [Trichomonas vaginalis G3]|eukprot:XP_001579552.1 hypothetical protein [Trichomonas vaginalis G3]
MEAAKAFAKHLYDHLLPYEDQITKFEATIAFGAAKWRGAVFFVLINLVYLLFKYLAIPTYSGLAIIALLYFSRSMWTPIFFKIINPSDIGEAPHHDLKEISSWFATVILVAVNLYNSAISSVTEKRFLGICTNLFIFMFLFYLFLSIPDYFLGLLIMNVLALTPFYLLKFDSCKNCILQKYHKSQKAE